MGIETVSTANHERDIAALPGDLGSTGLALCALELARQMDGEGSQTGKASCARALQRALSELRAMGPVERADAFDEKFTDMFALEDSISQRVTEALTVPSFQRSAYGPYAFGTSAHSDVYTTFGAGDGTVGIHGTGDPSSLGKDVSHGCIRLSNDGITSLIHQVPLGTPVEILA